MSAGSPKLDQTLYLSPSSLTTVSMLQRLHSTTKPPPLPLLKGESDDLTLEKPSSDIDELLEQRMTQLSEELNGPKKRVQASKSFEYPADAKSTVKLIGTRTLGVWTYHESSDTCAICRSELSALCVECEGTSRKAELCNVSWGMCKHGYHSHCILKWTEQRNACPICQQPWNCIEEDSPLS